MNPSQQPKQICQRLKGDGICNGRYIVLTSSSDEHRMAESLKLTAAGADMNAANSERIPLCHQTMRTGRESVIRFRLRHDADANARVPPAGTTLTQALLQGNKLIAWLLTKAGANIHVQHDGDNPLSPGC